MKKDHSLVIYDFDPRNLPSEFLRAIGLMTAAAAQTESVVQDFIGSLLGIDSIETIALTAHMAGPIKDHIARALIELNAVNASIVDAVDELLDAVKLATENRNIAVHSSYCIHPETKEILSYRQKARGSLQVSLQPISAEQIERDALLIYEAGMDIMRFMIAHGLKPTDRTQPIREPLDRGKAARKLRNSQKAGNGG
jgi:hypothetical protein